MNVGEIDEHTYFKKVCRVVEFMLEIASNGTKFQTCADVALKCGLNQSEARSEIFLREGFFEILMHER